MSMEIKGTSNVDRAQLRRTSSKKGGTGEAFSVSSQSDTPAQMVAGPGPLTALDSLLALQEVEDSTQGRSKGLKRGEKLLDMLDQIRDGLLAGGIPRETLQRLSQTVSQRQEDFTDPKLQEVLDEIDLRAKVELAKLEMNEKAGA
jgi:hypothetical protein